MKICILWKNDYPWDVRIEKFAITLKEAGHDVYLLCSNIKKLPREEIVNYIKIFRSPFSNNNLINSAISAPFYFNPFWLRMVNKIVKQHNIELIIVRDLPLILIALLIKKIYHIPLILDMAENYPAMYWNRIKKGGFSAFKNWFLKNPYLISYIEKYAIKRVDHIFVVVKESAKRLISKGANENKISIVSNTPDLKIFQKKRYNKKKYLQIIYIGFIQEGRGIDTVINSLYKIKENNGLAVKFIVIGDGDYLNQLKILVKKQSIEDVVEFKGWMKNTAIPQYIFESDIGIIPHRKTEHTDSTIPNKLFDYMACGKPVIVSNAEPMKRIVKEEKCGLVFCSGNV